MKKNVLLYLLLLVTFAAAMAGTVTAQTSTQAVIGVSVRIPAAQQFEQVEMPGIPIPAGTSDTIDVTGVGTVRIRSNVEWSLLVRSAPIEGYQVLVKPSSADHYQTMIDGTAAFSGIQGSHDLTWDIQIVPDNPASHDQELQFHFILSSW